MSKIAEGFKFVGKVALMDTGLEASIAEMRMYRRLHPDASYNGEDDYWQAIIALIWQLVSPASLAAVRETVNASEQADTRPRKAAVIVGGLLNIPSSLALDILVGTFEIQQLVKSGNFQQFLEMRAASSTAINILSEGYVRMTRRTTGEN